ncbi:hypothetical protein IX84_00760 [Phaeodactylibacter xiamenensis]|jgi:hypothetical protein|uniref:Uncharacterized protein n=1 Tax=Phaeodactylibacter xiamenensis TaxID=1524460 RepID=A0A098SCH3_9BACT|nr:hypothetical protein IX84_30895 [Phaeodactylibacter xiamenensis]KGE87278.1 hypothetical protein IX84_16700 [Phaeodactylibacter xiamenensis]KGE89871.1 hypothetical protein IX84_00760 [Phaeodactylibacter xiamenensis]
MADRKASQLDLSAPKVLVSCEGAKLNQSVSLQGVVKVQVKTIVGGTPMRNYGKVVTSPA